MMKAAKLTNEPRMEEKIKVLVEKAQKIMGNDSHFLLVFSKDDTGVAALSGKELEIAEKLFMLLNQAEKGLDQQLYEILRNVVVNLITNDTEFGRDLVSLIEKIKNQ